eukprot:1192398-Prorocentrum_minimum.AAC.1
MLDNQARATMLKGIDKLANAVGVTIGPRGRLVCFLRFDAAIYPHLHCMSSTAGPNACAARRFEALMRVPVGVPRRPQRCAGEQLRHASGAPALPPLAEAWNIPCTSPPRWLRPGAYSLIL